MRIISRKPLNEFAEIHPECEAGLGHWYREMKKGNFSNIQEVRSVFPHADKDGKFTIFNIGGNKARIVAAIHYGDRKRVYIRHVLTHSEYDLGKWRE